jgi:hypothetical protein
MRRLARSHDRLPTPRGLVVLSATVDWAEHRLDVENWCPVQGFEPTDRQPLMSDPEHNDAV